MSYFTKGKGFIVVIGVLVILNVVLLFSYWHRHNDGFSSHHSHHPNRGDGARLEHFLERKLGLNEQQKRAYRKMRKVHFQEVKKAKKEIKILKDSLLLQMPDTADSSKVNQLTQRIGKKQAMLERQTFYHFQQLRSVCTPEQQQQFDHVLRKAFSKFQRFGPPDRSRGPHGKRHKRGNH